jgi:nitrogen-specific signal transduction histidine kinase
MKIRLAKTVSIRTSRVGKLCPAIRSDRGQVFRRQIKEVFEPFFTSKAEGMAGLSIARTIIEAHNGQISAKIGIMAAHLPIRLPRPIVGNPWHDANEVDPTSGDGTFRHAVMSELSRLCEQK